MNRFFLSPLAALFSALACAGAHADEARVLPEGRSKLSFIFAKTGDIDQEYNSDGKSESITAPYQFDLSSNTLAQANTSIPALINLLNNFNIRYNVNDRNNGYYGATLDPSQPKLGDALSGGFFDIGAVAQRTQYNVLYQFGLTPRFSFALALPIIHNTINVSPNFSGVNTADDIYNLLKSSFTQSDPSLSQALDGLNQIRSINLDTIQGVLVSHGYNPLANYSRTGIGDLILGGRYNYYNVETNAGTLLGSFQGRINLPTGRLKDPNNLVDMDFGDGVVEAMLSHITNYRPIPQVMFSHTISYTASLPGNRPMRVEENPSELLTSAADLDPKVHYHLGDRLATNVGALWGITDTIIIDGSCEWAWKYRDSYNGTFGDRSYGYLSDFTNVYTETLHFGAAVSSIAPFLRQHFPVPGDISLDTYIPLVGRNTYVTPYTTLELALYF